MNRAEPTKKEMGEFWNLFTNKSSPHKLDYKDFKFINAYNFCLNKPKGITQKDYIGLIRKK